MGNVPEKGRSAHQGAAGARWSAARRDVLHRLFFARFFGVAQNQASD